MRLLGDLRAEIGFFEDLQTLVILLVGIAVLLASTLLNWSSFGEAQADQELYEEAEHLVSEIESWQRIKAVNSYGSTYNEFLLRQADLAQLANGTNRQFTDQIRSDLSYNITFDDLVVPDTSHDPANEVFSHYQFGPPAPKGVERAVLTVQYALVFESGVVPDLDVGVRHACLMTVVVWR